MKFYGMARAGLRTDEAKNLHLHNSRHARKNVNELLDQARSAEVRLETLRGRPTDWHRSCSCRGISQPNDTARMALHTPRAKQRLENYSEDLPTVSLDIIWKAPEGEGTVTVITSPAHQSVTGCEK